MCVRAAELQIQLIQSMGTLPCPLMNSPPCLSRAAKLVHLRQKWLPCDSLLISEFCFVQVIVSVLVSLPAHLMKA